MGEFAQAKQPNITYNSKVKDPIGTFKHEIGHGLFYSLLPDELKQIQKIYDKEDRNLYNYSNRSLNHYRGVNGLTETFAELYAAAQGKTSPTIEILTKAFPQLFKFIKDTYSIKK